MHTVIAILMVVCMVSFTGIIIVTGPEGKFGKIYCYLFEHKDWQKWEKVCQVLPELKLSEHRVFDECEKLNSYEFLLPNTGISDKDLVVIYWETINEVCRYMKSVVVNASCALLISTTPVRLLKF